MTRDYKRGLNKEQRKQFRARMWEFRRRPQDLLAEPAEALEALFEAVPALRVIYQLRWKLTGIFDDDHREHDLPRVPNSWPEAPPCPVVEWDESPEFPE